MNGRIILNWTSQKYGGHFAQDRIQGRTFVNTIMNCWLPLAPYVLKHVQVCVLHACKSRRTADQSLTVYGQCSEIGDNRNAQRVLVEILNEREKLQDQGV